MKDKVIYLGHKVCKLGISPVRNKIEDWLLSQVSAGSSYCNSTTGSTEEKGREVALD